MDSIFLENDILGLKILPYGAIIQDLVYKNGSSPLPLVVGHEDADTYLDNPWYLGACIGRNAGRIGSGGFYLGDQFYSLPSENGVHLHGGPQGLHQKKWEIEQIDQGDVPSVRLTCTSPDGESGYPGNLQVWITYSLEAGTLHIDYSAEIDQPCPINLTQHTYFLLDDARNVDDYELEINAQSYLETDEHQIPTGKILDVTESEYDFRQKRRIGTRRLDTAYVVNANPIARLYSPKSRIQMTVRTDQPAVVVFTPPHFPGICFETQHYPDAPNNKDFPNTLLHPGESYMHRSSFTFDLVP